MKAYVFEENNEWIWTRRGIIEITEDLPVFSGSGNPKEIKVPTEFKKIYKEYFGNEKNFYEIPKEFEQNVGIIFDEKRFIFFARYKKSLFFGDSRQYRQKAKINKRKVLNVLKKARVAFKKKTNEEMENHLGLCNFFEKNGLNDIEIQLILGERYRKTSYSFGMGKSQSALWSMFLERSDFCKHKAEKSESEKIRKVCKKAAKVFSQKPSDKLKNATGLCLFLKEEGLKDSEIKLILGNHYDRGEFTFGYERSQMELWNMLIERSDFCNKRIKEIMEEK